MIDGDFQRSPIYLHFRPIIEITPKTNFVSK
jgi:hypothetical protein